MIGMNDDHHFPRYHVRPPTGFVNDPNGPFVGSDGIHLYFQYRAATDGTTPVVWGHSSSSDYVHWRLHEPAIRPTPDGRDRGGCWSGSTVVDGAAIIAFYSAFDPSLPYQSVVSATSWDGGRSFGASSQVVDDPNEGENVTHFRDPFVWWDQGRWRMVVGAGGERGASARLYESLDRQCWQHRGVLAELPRQELAGSDTGAMWECPQVVALSGVEVLIVSPWSPASDLAQVLTLSNAGEALRVGRLDHGSNFYAASVLRESPFGPLVWGWATEARSDEWAVEVDWSGLLTLPRRLSLRDDGTVASFPLPAMHELRTRPVEVYRSDDGLRLTGLPAQAEIRLVLADDDDDPDTRLRITFSESEHLDLLIDRIQSTIVIDRTLASSDLRAVRDRIHFVEPHAGPGRALELTLYLDGSIVELFTSSGRCATVRMYPTTPPPWELDLRGVSQRSSLDVWALEARGPE